MKHATPYIVLEDSDFNVDEKDKLIKELSDDVVELTTQDETFTNCFGEKMKRTKQ